MSRMLKRVLSLFLVLTLLLPNMATVALAAEEDNVPVTESAAEPTGESTVPTEETAEPTVPTEENLKPKNGTSVIENTDTDNIAAATSDIELNTSAVCSAAVGDIDPNNHIFVDGVCACGLLGGECGLEGDNAFWTLNGAGLLTISGTGAMGNYSASMQAPWRAHSKQIFSIVVGEGITAIGNGAFSGLTAVTNVRLPTSITAIRRGAFSSCTKLQHVTIPDAVVTIGENAFQSCKSLSTVTLSKSLRNIGQDAFMYDDSLTGVYISDLYAWCNVEFGTLYSNPLYYGKKLYLNGDLATKLEIPQGIAKIKRFAFSGAAAVTNVIIPEGVTEIQNNAFYVCDTLASVTLPDTLTSIGNSAFAYCYQLKSINISKNVVSLGDNSFLRCRSMTSITIPEKVASIGGSAFYACDKLQNVYISDLTAWLSIDFKESTSNPLNCADNLYLNGVLVKNLVIPDGITSIRKNAFCFANCLTSVTIPAGVTSIGSLAFGYCKNIAKVTLPESITTIGDTAFGYNSLTSLVIPASVTNMDAYAFRDCKKLASVTFQGSAPSISKETFYGVVTTAYYPAADNTWINTLAKQYDGTITWVPYGEVKKISIDSAHFPDAVFRAYISENFDLDRDGSLTEAERNAVTKISVNDMSIASLAGVEYFTSLTDLNCQNNQLTSLDVSDCTALTGLVCGNNQYTIQLTDNTFDLTTLPGNFDVSSAGNWAGGNVAGKVLTVESGITQVTYTYDCGNGLREVFTLNILAQAHNWSDATCTAPKTCLACGATEGAPLGHAWADATCITPRICPVCGTTEGNPLGHTAENGVCTVCKNVFIPIDAVNFPDSIFRSYLSGQFDTNKDGYLEDAERNAVTEISVRSKKIGSLQGIEYFTALTKLDCAYNKLTSLDVSDCTALTYLSCSDNQLTSLDVSGCTALKTLYCSYNYQHLTNLDVSTCTALTKLNCDYNQLTSLDVSRNTALTELSCATIRLTDLDVRSNTALERLACPYNQLTNLDVSRNTALTYLVCDGNQLASLDVSRNTALEYLSCSQNQLARLDVSRNTTLTGLDCNENQLTDLNVQGCRMLTRLNCYSNQLSTLDVSDCTVLPELNCTDNQLTDLNVSSCRSLKQLLCYDNQLAAVDVSGCPALTGLSCGNNQLTSLDLSWCPTLEKLSFERNQLTSVDLSVCPRLMVLDCASNQLTNLDVSCCPDLVTLDCFKNKLTTLDVSCCPNLFSLHCYNNQLTSLDLSVCGPISYFHAYGNQYTIQLTGSTFDLSTLPGNFDAAKASNWACGTVDGNILTVKPEKTWVSYDYDCGNGQSIFCTLNIENVHIHSFTAATCITSKICSVCGETEGDSLGHSIKNGVCTACGWISIDAENFPDPVFKDYVKETFDNNTDAMLSTGEIAAAEKIHVYGKGISSLKGVEYFTSLKILECTQNNLTTLDVSQNTLLTLLACEENQLTSLDLSQNTELEDLRTENNVYPIQSNPFDLTTLPGGFDGANASGWTGGSLISNFLTVNPGTELVQYTYDCGSNKTADFCLKLTGFVNTPLTLDSLVLSKSSAWVGDAITATAQMSGTGSIDTATYTLFYKEHADDLPQEITTSANNATTFRFVPDKAGLWWVSVGMSTKGGHSFLKETSMLKVTAIPAGTTGNHVQRPSSSGNNTDLSKAEVSGLDAEAESWKEPGKEVVVTVSMDYVPKGTTSSDAAAIFSIANVKTVDLVEIGISKSVDGVSSRLEETNTVLDLRIPFDARGKPHIEIFRIHNDEVTVFTALSKPPTDPVDGTYYVDRSTKTLHLYSSCYSLYGIGYNTSCTEGHTWTEATCINPKTCSVCGETEGGLLDHIFENGVCTVCGTEASPAAILIDNGRSISLEGEIYINQYIGIESFEKDYVEANGGLLIWKKLVTEEAAVYGNQHELKEGLTFNGSYNDKPEYGVRTNGIYAKQYADELYLRTYLKMEDGSYAYGPLVEYSVQDYCEDKLERDDLTENLKNVCAAMLHFGAAAQIQFKYNQSDLANANILASWPAESWDASLLTALVPANTALAGTGDVQNTANTISLDSELTINTYFKPSSGTWSITGGTLQVWDGVTGVLTEENVSYEVPMMDNTARYDGEWGGRTGGIATKKYANTVYLRACLTGSDEQTHYSEVIPYSPEAYAANQIKRNENAALVDLVKKMVLYGEQARIYFNK